MKVKLRARKLWMAIEKGTDVEDDDVSAMEALLSSTPPEYHQMLGEKKNARTPGTHSRPCALARLEPRRRRCSSCTATSTT